MAGTSSSLSVAAHVVAGGSTPPLGATVVITFLLAGAGIALADRQRGVLGILGALGASQLALHLILETMSEQCMHGMSEMNPVMTLGHACVVLLTGLAMAHAERALFVVARLIQAILPKRVGPLPVVTPPPVICVPAPHTRTLATLIYQRIHARRGPPKSLIGNILG